MRSADRVTGSERWFGRETPGRSGLARRPALARFVASLAIVTMLAPTVAHADARSEARAHHRRGMELIRAERYDEAAAELILAYETLPHPNVLANVARAYALAGRYEESIDYFERYLETSPRNADEIRENIRTLRAALAAETTAEAPEPPPAPEPEAPPSFEAERASLLAAAEELEGLARLTQSESMAARAAELRRLADQLAAGQPATTTPTGEGAPTTTATEEPQPAPAEPTVELAGEEEADAATYEESVEAASHSASSPLDAPASTTIITRQDIRLSGATSIVEVLRRAAGVSVMVPIPNNGNVGIRGFNRLPSPRVLMLINGRPTYLDALGSTFWDYQPILLEDVERIEIIRGPASVIYGANGFSGIVNLVLREPGGRMANEMSAGVGNASTIRGHGSVSGRAGVIQYRAHAGYQQGNRFAMPYDTDRVDLGAPVDNLDLAFRASNAGVQLRTEFGRSGSVTVEGGISYADRMTFFGSGAFRDFVGKLMTSYGMATLESDHGRIRVFENHLQADDMLVLGNELPSTVMTNDTLDVEATLHERFRLGVDHDLHVGVNYRYNSVDWSYIGPDPRRRSQFGAFLEDAMQAGEYVRIVGAIRVDRHPLVDHWIFSPRGAIVVRPSESRAVRVSASTAFRTPPYLEAYADLAVSSPVSAINARLIGGLRDEGNVEPEKIVSFELGYLDQSSDYLSFDAAGYYNIITNLIHSAGDAELYTLYDALAGPNPVGFLRDRNAFLVGTTTIGNQDKTYYVFGGEASVHAFPVQGLDLSLNYSINAAYTQDSVEGAVWDRRTSRHMLNTSVQYRSSVGVDVSTDFHVSSKQVWREFVPTETGVVMESFPLPAFYLLNARVGYRFDHDRFEVALSGYNITRSRHRQHPIGQPLDIRYMATFAIRMGQP